MYSAISFNRKKTFLPCLLLFLFIVITTELTLLNKSKFLNKQIFSVNSSFATIELQGKGFNPEEIKIRKNTTVKFTTTRNSAFWPASNLHPTHLIYPQFDPRRPIQAKESWSFKFDKVGTWRYHDHLYPNFTGTIIVVDNNDAQGNNVLAKTTACEGVNIGQKQQCWDALLEATVKQQGLDAAFDLFTKLYQTDPSIPKACHGWAHILGKAAYTLFRNNKNFILRKETSYCGYGFFHGFIEKLLQDTGDVKATREFCNYASKQLGKEGSAVYGNCLHGIGHGSVGIDDPKLWGNFQAMVDIGLKTCEAALNKNELRQCYDGAFNAMQQNALHGDYKLSVDRNDLFKICRVQKEQYKDACYYEFTGLIADMTNHDFKKAADLILKEINGKDFAPRIFLKLSADFFQTDITNTDYTKNVLDCRALPDNLISACFNGILLGFIAHGEPNRQYIKGLEFCKYSILDDKERESCYQWILGQTVKKDTPVCNSVQDRYRKYCQA